MARTTELRDGVTGQVGALARAAGRYRDQVLVSLLLILVSASAVAVEAMAPRWQFDAERSQIRFELSALGVLSIDGGFTQFEGRSWADPDDGLWRIETRIDATSMTITPERYLGWARSGEFFDVQDHPEIRFRSDPVPERLLREGGELSGQLTLRGVERPVLFQVAAAQCEPGMRACMIQVSGEINRRQFGMNSRRMTLSNRVRLDLRLLSLPDEP